MSFNCSACQHALPDFLFSKSHPLYHSAHVNPRSPPSTSALLDDAFNPSRLNSYGLASPPPRSAQLSRTVSHNDLPLPLVQTVYTRYRQQPNCIALAITHGVRGAVVGSVFGCAMSLSSVVSSGYRGSAAVTYVGQGALRNAAGFASWTALFGLSRCSLARLRHRDDMLNSAMAGAFTGGILTLITVRGSWRYNQSTILTNSASSAMIAVMFDALNYF